MTWTRAVLITAVLGFAVITTSAQSNPATSIPPAAADANQTQDQAASPAQEVKSR